MTPISSRERSARAWALAGRQHGVVARRQLLGPGFTHDAIKHRLRTGRLRRVGRGVFVVGCAELTERGRWMAAVLSCGEGAFLGHRSAGALYGIAQERPGVIEVSVPSPTARTHPGLRVRRRPSVPGKDVGTFDGIPITSPVRTMLDLATVLGPRSLERAVNEADKREVIDPEALRSALDDCPGQPGVRALRNLLDRDTFRLSDEELERLFHPLALESGLPLPETKQIVNEFEVDFYWPELKLVVETDGLRYHRTPSAQARDALRDQTHTAAGYTRLRFTHHQVKFESEHVRRILTQTASWIQPPKPTARRRSAGSRR